MLAPDEKLKKTNHQQPASPKIGFLDDFCHRARKLITHLQLPNRNSPVKFDDQSSIITPFIPHMCSVQCH